MLKVKLALAALTVVAGMSTLYPTAAVVTDITDDVVTVETSTGFLYQYTGGDDDMVGDMVAMIMYNNGTPETILDDIIISHRYTGFWMDR